MTLAQIVSKTNQGTLTIGDVPRVVGTLTSFKADFPCSLDEMPCDMVEIRLDLIGPESDWLKLGNSIQHMGLPVILTVRLRDEGGKWTLPDEDRLAIYQRAIEQVSAVDVELHSEIAERVSLAAKKAGKVCILSFHDFDKTPSLERLQSIMTKGQKLGSVVKISTMVQTEKDVETLQALLKGKWEVPICVIGMGSLGTPTRVSFALMGSCLTYGYLLNEASAPGQLSAAQLTAKLRSSHPTFEKEYLHRRSLLDQH